LCVLYRKELDNLFFFSFNSHSSSKAFERSINCWNILSAVCLLFKIKSKEK
jgi:hypothetical protein